MRAAKPQVQGISEADAMAAPGGGFGADRLFIYALRNVTEAAARAAHHWAGRGDRGQGDRMAVGAMRRALERLPIHAHIVTGEGEDEETGGLMTGSGIGDPASAMQFDVAVDPVEGISYLARGMTNAMAVIALAPRGTMMDPGPSFYMEKFVAPPKAEGRIDPDMPVKDRLKALSKALEKPVSELTVFVLEKPRHRNLVEQIHDAGARVALYPAGDVAGALMAATPESGIDALMGTGGTREGLISACAIRAMGGVFQARFDPQLSTEKAAVIKAGIDTAVWRDASEMITSDRVFFSATGITTGLLFTGVERTRWCERTQTLMIAGPMGELELITTHHRDIEDGAKEGNDA